MFPSAPGVEEPRNKENHKNAESEVVWSRVGWGLGVIPLSRQSGRAPGCCQPAQPGRSQASSWRRRFFEMGRGWISPKCGVGFPPNLCIVVYCPLFGLYCVVPLLHFVCPCIVHVFHVFFPIPKMCIDLAPRYTYSIHDSNSIHHDT